MAKHWILCACLWLLALTALPRAARADDGPVSIRGVISTTPVPRGASADIILQLAIDPEYHIQSAAPHDPSLIPTTVSIAPAAGLTFGQPQFPVAAELPVPAGLPGPPTIAAYRGTVYLKVPVTVAADAALGARTLEVSVQSQACTDKMCLPPDTTVVKIPLTIAAAGAATEQTDHTLIAAANQQPYATAATQSPPPAPAAPAAPSGAEPAPPAPISAAAADQQLALINARDYRPGNSQEQTYSIGWLILLGLVGGAILNIMPCVLPVIPLKVLGLVQQAHGDRRLALLHGLSFSAGVITLFIALAVVLKAFGLFYGQQFQSPAFLLTMALLVVALGLSMLGVWTINPPQALYTLTPAFPVEHLPNQSPGPAQSSALSPQHSSHLASFTNGLMATLLATPCSAPYLGGVLAWAFGRPMWVTALALGWVGVGMSLPYLILAAFPKLLAKVPRAGRWSELLKQGLGIVMLGVAVYLITLLPNVALWPWAMLGAVVVGMVCWAWGQIPSLSMSLAKIWSIRTVAVALGVVLGAGLWVLGARAASAADSNLWQPFSVEALDAGLKSGRPVVIDWTADWCINCHALEALVLSSADVRTEFAASNAILLKADLSRDNPPASALNAKLGGKSIPVLAIFSPTHPFEPVVLRDGYTRSRVVDELRHAH
ncbi:MAG TPA: cytochrome c biogenesis protein CcdA [Phycisphaerae bacterium]|nr:cytochrome c biogenesis protein CcdA [Phycisphaerae bacterium]